MSHDDNYERLPELVGLRAASTDDAQIAAHLAECPRCRDRLAALERTARALERAGANPLAMPDGLDARVLAIPGDADRGRRRAWRRRLAFGIPSLAAVAGALVVALVMFTGPDTKRFELDRSVALRPIGTATAAGMVEVSRPEGQYRIVRLKVHGLPVDGEHSFDLWMMDGKGAMKAGTFGPDPDGACEVELMIPAGERWDRMAITQSGSSPDGPKLAMS